MFKNSTQITFDRNWEFAKASTGWVLIFFEIVVFIIGLIVGFASYETDKVYAIMLWIAFAVAMAILPPFTKSSFRKSIKTIMMKNPLQDENVVNHFTFTESELSVTSTKFEKEVSNLNVNYNDIAKVIENKDNIYIYIGQNQALLLSAQGMTEGSYQGLVQFLKSKYTAAGKYYIRKRILHIKQK